MNLIEMQKKRAKTSINKTFTLYELNKKNISEDLKSKIEQYLKDANYFLETGDFFSAFGASDYVYGLIEGNLSAYTDILLINLKNKEFIQLKLINVIKGLDDLDNLAKKTKDEKVIIENNTIFDLLNNGLNENCSKIKNIKYFKQTIILYLNNEFPNIKWNKLNSLENKQLYNFIINI